MNKIPQKFKQANIPEPSNTPRTRQVIDNYLSEFRGQTKVQRGPDWDLKGGGQSTSSFLQSVQSVSSSMIPTANNIYSLGSGTFKWSDIRTVLINGVTPRSGSVTYYVAATSGGAVTTAITFNTGILT